MLYFYDKENNDDQQNMKKTNIVNSLLSSIGLRRGVLPKAFDQDTS